MGPVEVSPPENHNIGAVGERERVGVEGVEEVEVVDEPERQIHRSFGRRWKKTSNKREGRERNLGLLRFRNPSKLLKKLFLRKT